MPTMHLGVLEILYVNAPTPKAKASKGGKGGKKPGKTTPRTGPRGGTKSTADIAGFLEARYHLMQTYFNLHSKYISGQVEESLRDAMESIMMGAPATIDPMGAATSDVETDFKRALSLREFDGRIAGVPTKASIAGVSHRFKHPYAKRPSRPSFIDTGLFQSSFKAWVG